VCSYQGPLPGATVRVVNGDPDMLCGSWVRDTVSPMGVAIAANNCPWRTFGPQGHNGVSCELDQVAEIQQLALIGSTACHIRLQLERRPGAHRGRHVRPGPGIPGGRSLQSEACPATGAGEGHCGGDIAAELERDLAAPDNCLWPATDGPLVLARHRWPVMAMLVLAVRNRIPDIHTGNRRLGSSVCGRGAPEGQGNCHTEKL
jgi:hypothetical protein